MFLSWFGLGLLGRAPGTLGSLGSMPLAAALVLTGGPWILLAAAVLVFFLGWRLAVLHMRDMFDLRGVDVSGGDLKDPQWIVIDEVAAQWAVLAALPFSLPWYAAGFVAFRFFDIVKPWPVSWADRKIGGGLGVMFDDVLAALYAIAILLAARAVL